jgi:DNA polymerase epsilon subunit 1
VPVCNIENDFTLFLSDLFMARRLKEQDCLLWCSNSAKADLGGSEQDDNLSFLEEFKCPEINNPGTFDTICIEMDLWDLSLSTLIKSNDSNGDLDNMALINARGNVHLLDDHFSKKGKAPLITKSKLQDVESPQNALGTIRSMIKGWVHEVRAGNKFASNLLEHLHRWLTSQSALLYDSLVVSHTMNLMKRSFAMLLDELRRLGSKIVYANFEKIVVMTTKRELKTGVGYIQYVLAAISKNPNFEHIELKPCSIWDFLIWYDTFNHGGLNYQSGFENLNSQAIVDMRWNIAEYLPPQVQQIFLKTVAEYLYIIETLKETPEELETFISTELKRKLMKSVTDIQHHRIIIGEFLENSYKFPTLPGSTYEMKSPSLEFIKTITMILQLDRRFENPQRLLKKDLLRLIDVREFSATAIFKNPCEKYVLSQVICEYCNYCSDLDLTRKHTHADFLECDGCGMGYSKDDIELFLIKDAQALLTRWQLQDLRCVKCRLLTECVLSEVCEKCTGELETVLKRNVFVDLISVLRNLAKFYSMSNLEEFLTFIIV